MQAPDSNRGAEPSVCVLVAVPNRPIPTILLVEDEAFVREVACEILRVAGYRVLPARNAAEAVPAFLAHREEVQLLLTDVVLPDRNGRDLAFELVTLGQPSGSFSSRDIRRIRLPETDFRSPGGFIFPNHSPPLPCCKKSMK